MEEDNKFIEEIKEESLINIDIDVVKSEPGTSGEYFEDGDSIVPQGDTIELSSDLGSESDLQSESDFDSDKPGPPKLRQSLDEDYNPPSKIVKAAKPKRRRTRRRIQLIKKRKPDEVKKKNKVLKEPFFPAQLLSKKIVNDAIKTVIEPAVSVLLTAACVTAMTMGCPSGSSSIASSPTTTTVTQSLKKPILSTIILTPKEINRQKTEDSPPMHGFESPIPSTGSPLPYPTNIRIVAVQSLSPCSVWSPPDNVPGPSRPDTSVAVTTQSSFKAPTTPATKNVKRKASDKNTTPNASFIVVDGKTYKLPDPKQPLSNLTTLSPPRPVCSDPSRSRLRYFDQPLRLFQELIPEHLRNPDPPAMEHELSSQGIRQDGRSPGQSGRRNSKWSPLRLYPEIWHGGVPQFRYADGETPYCVTTLPACRSMKMINTGFDVVQHILDRTDRETVDSENQLMLVFNRKEQGLSLYRSLHIAPDAENAGLFCSHCDPGELYLNFHRVKSSFSIPSCRTE